MHPTQTKNFEAGLLTASIVGPLDDQVGAVAMEDVWDGDILTSAIEFKKKGVKLEQTLAKMLCMLTNWSIDVLRNGKQINKATINGLSIDYGAARATLHKIH